MIPRRDRAEPDIDADQASAEYRDDRTLPLELDLDEQGQRVQRPKRRRRAGRGNAEPSVIFEIVYEFVLGILP
jgi:hypothetical protein